MGFRSNYWSGVSCVLVVLLAGVCAQPGGVHHCEIGYHSWI